MILRTYTNALWQTQNLPKATDKKATSGKRSGPKSVMTDDQLRECRARHQYFCWTASKCAKHYGVKYQTMKNLLEYINRADVIAKPHHANLEVCNEQ